MVNPARCRTFWVAEIGPKPMQLGSTPATAVARILARGLGPPVRSSDHEERRRAVIDPARARRRDDAALAKRRLELRDGLEGRARTGILVLGERRPVGKGDGNQF